MNLPNIGKVTYFDVEYANSHNQSICQIGLVCEDFATGEPYYPERGIYINPEDHFDDNCVRIHGITADDVKDCPSFPDIWKDIEKYFTNTVIIGHNVSASDLSALSKTLQRYHLDIPEMYYACTLDIARKYVPRYAVPNYGMSALCSYFDVDIDSAHDAFDDACANSDLFKILVSEYSLDLNEHIKKYIPKSDFHFSEYISDTVLRKSISEFYGIVRGFSIDNVISPDEADYIRNWRIANEKYSAQPEIANINASIDRILSDGVVTSSEIILLQRTIKQYLDLVSTSPVTLATQILDGILKGIVADGNVTTEECFHLQQWLYDNVYLSGHYPFDKVISILENVLSDMIISKEESEYITSTINDLLNPVDALKEHVNSVDGMHVCLSGVFSYGSKSKVAEYLKNRGGIVEDYVTRSTDILLIGAQECQSYSNGKYGTKVKKAIEYNENGCNIKIVKESDLIIP